MKKPSLELKPVLGDITHQVVNMTVQIKEQADDYSTENINKDCQDENIKEDDFSVDDIYDPAICDQIDIVEEFKIEATAEAVEPINNKEDCHVINVEKEIEQDKTCKQSEIFEMAKVDFKTLWKELYTDLL